MKVLLLSGGLDSTVLFYDLLSHDDEFMCAWVDYGQKNAREEQRAVQKLCHENTIPLKEVFAPLVFEGIESTLLKGVEGEHDVQKDEVINRNATLLCIVASHIAHMCRDTGKQATLLVAAHKTGAPYADATKVFYTRASKLIHWSTNARVDVEAPYINLTKKQIVRRAWDLAVSPKDIKATVSCYEGNGCGRCPACKARKKAFEGTPFQDLVNQ